MLEGNAGLNIPYHVSSAALYVEGKSNTFLIERYEWLFPFACLCASMKQTVSLQCPGAHSVTVLCSEQRVLKSFGFPSVTV